VEVLGKGGFAEIEWEETPDLFSRVGIDVVPCTVVVAADGTSTRYPGMVDGSLLT
jgi:hypothetical protein